MTAFFRPSLTCMVPACLLVVSLLLFFFMFRICCVSLPCVLLFTVHMTSPGLCDNVAGATAGVAAVVCVSETVDDAMETLALCARHPGTLFPCVGLHPVQPGNRSLRPEDVPPLLDVLRLHRDAVVGVGEIGLDFRPSVLAKEDVDGDKRRQVHAFKLQCEAAVAAGLSVNVHSRGAGHHAIQALREAGVGRYGAVLHAFDGKAKYAVEAARDLGYVFSVPPCVVRSPQMQKMVRLLPLDALVLETDSPALAAVAGDANEPRYLPTAARAVADIKKLPLHDVVAATTATACKLFPKLAEHVKPPAPS